MWRSIVSSSSYKVPYIWEEHTKTLGDNGLYTTAITQYNDIAMYVSMLPAELKKTATGYFNVKIAQAIVPYIHLHDNNITPSTHTSHIRRNDELWRVVEIDDQSETMQNHTYTLTLERVELDDK